MKLKRLLALGLSLCMLLSLTLTTGVAYAVEEDAESVISEDLAVNELDGSDFDVDLTREPEETSDLTLDTESVDANQAVKVIIVMEGDSIVEADSAAVPNEETQEMAAALEETQAEVVAEIEETVLEGESLEVSYHYTWLLNGVAATVPYGTLDAIQAIDGVKRVVVQPVYEICETTQSTGVANPNTVSDGVMIGRESTWAQGYTGQGIKIAILDTGLDADHQNFGPLSEDKLTGASATEETVAAVLDSLNASARYGSLSVDDVWYSTKVAFGFNYCDNTLDITHDNDTEGDHGTHVAGIAAANKVEGSDVVGVAPDAQLYIMKVFGQNGGAYTEDILAALEDALMLGADVVNMSLGSPAGFTSGDTLEDAEGVLYVDEVYNRVADTGTVLTISAGNEYTSGYYNQWGTDANLTTNPDNASVGSPGTYANVLSVASVENWKLWSYYIDAEGHQIAYSEGSYQSTEGYNDPLYSLTGQYELVAVPGYGAPEDYEGLDVEGKVALVMRGSISFADKCSNAADAGAAACIIFNNTTGTIGILLDGCTSHIPCVSITLADGLYLLYALEENPGLTLTFPAEEASVPNAAAYQMSDFSGWGVAPDLTLEPDITAPGGNIYSTLDGGEYGLMSGTSMAAPNLAGMSALVMQYVKEAFPSYTPAQQRALVRDLLMSTSVPLTWDGGLYYSPRSQGSGLANAFNSIATQAYLTVDGCDTAKAELGDDPDRTGEYSFIFDVNNFGEVPVYYDLDTVAQTEDFLDYSAYGAPYEDVYFMSSTPIALEAATAEGSDSMVLTHDVDDSGAANSHDAYWVYRAAIGAPESADAWANESFRYDLNGDESVDTADVQAYLDALVDNDSPADLTATVLRVAAGETAAVSVSVTLSDADKAYFDTYYENGCYVEGFTFLTARNSGGVDLSLPYLAFYGGWNEAPVIDDGDYWLLYTEEYADFDPDYDKYPGSQYMNELYTNYYGYDSYAWPGLNPYLDDELFDMSHMSVSPNDDGYYDTIDDIYTSLLRNASALTFRYTNTDTGEVYYEQTVTNVSKTVYSNYYGLCVPFVYSWLEDYGRTPYDWKDAEGNGLTNNTHLLLEVEATGVAPKGGSTPEPETWSVPVTVDLEAPGLLGARKLKDLDTDEVTLELTFRDNVSTAVVALMDSTGSTLYAMDGVEDPEPDEDGYRTYTVSYDVTGLSGKLVVVLGDYACNESYFGLNIGGVGTPYGDYVGYQYNFNAGTTGWVAFDADVSLNETQVSMDEMNFVCAEYVNGYVFAETETGALYGFRYDELLGDNMAPEITYITQLENVYQDLAFNYADGKLYGLYSYEEEWYGEVEATTEVYSINLNGEYYDEDEWMTVAPYQEDWVASRGGLYGLTLAIDDEGSFYVLGTSSEEVYDEELDDWTYVESDAQLWKCAPTASWWGGMSYVFQLVGDTGLSMDYLQSMTWDHNTESLVWARFDVVGWNLVSELIRIDVTEDDEGNDVVSCTKTGTLSGETCALMSPLTGKAAALEAHANVPALDSSVVGRPVLRDDTVTMNTGSTYTLAYDFDPWYTDHRTVIWSSDDETVATVDANGTVTAVGQGTAIITAAAKDDPTLTDTCEVNVTALDLKLEGIISAQSAGIGSVTGVSTYQFILDNGVPSFGTVNAITASEELNFGLSLATSAKGRGSIWASEYGNTGMIYEIDAETGAVKDVLEPVDGHMLFGLTYSEKLDNFAGIMNMHLFVDQPLTRESYALMEASYDEETNEYTWHNVNMLDYLIESNTGFVTGEDGNGASSEIVFCGITTMETPVFYENTYKDYLGNWDYNMVNYISTQTLVLLDNVGRLWYIDEITGMTYEDGYYMSADGESMIAEGRNGVFAVEYPSEDGASTYSVFHIRALEESPLTDMFRQGTMPRITYHFSDIEYAGKTAEGDPIFALSLYDYWNEGTTNELYLYVPGHETDEMDYETWEPIRTPDRLLSLGNTGNHNIIASIHSAEVTGGLDPVENETAPETFSEASNKLAVSYYQG